jgi:DOPA 4,5-dioxygenase
MKDEFNEVAEVRGYHAHIYFDQTNEATAREIVKELKARFPDTLESTGKIGAIGPHTGPNYAIHMTADGFSDIVPWLQINSRGLSILIHPDRGDDLRDHIGPSMWLGTPVPYNDAFFDRLRQQRPRP